MDKRKALSPRKKWTHQRSTQQA